MSNISLWTSKLNSSILNIQSSPSLTPEQMTSIVTELESLRDLPLKHVSSHIGDLTTTIQYFSVIKNSPVYIEGDICSSITSYITSIGDMVSDQVADLIVSATEGADSETLSSILDTINSAYSTITQTIDSANQFKTLLSSTVNSFINILSMLNSPCAVMDAIADPSGVIADSGSVLASSASTAKEIINNSTDPTDKTSLSNKAWETAINSSGLSAIL